MANTESEEINFHHYINAVKQKTIPWNIFIDLMRDLSYSDILRLRKLNAILLTELTVDYSDRDKMKYLNGLLLSQFKNYIQSIEISENENLEHITESDILIEENTSIEEKASIQGF